jgi:hypothetical protein
MLIREMFWHTFPSNQDVLLTYAFFLSRITLSQLRSIIDPYFWTVLLTLLCPSRIFMVFDRQAVFNQLLVSRSRDDYALFVETGLFEQAMKRLNPAYVTVPILYRPDVDCWSEDFAALGIVWFVFSHI